MFPKERAVDYEGVVPRSSQIKYVGKRIFSKSKCLETAAERFRHCSPPGVCAFWK